MNSIIKRYGILVNPLAGKLTVEQKLAALQEPAKILNAEIHGLDTNSAEEFQACAREIADKYDVIIAAGGDGTFSDILNAIDDTHKLLAYLPLGSGNALQYALDYHGNLSEISRRILHGKVHAYDLIDCDGRKRAFMVSIGIEGSIIQLRNLYMEKGDRGLITYIKSTLLAFLKEYKGLSATLNIDSLSIRVTDILNISIVKQPYYGYGMRMVPQALFDDKQLHLLYINSGLLNSIVSGVTAFTVGNQIGKYHSCKELTVELDSPSVLQVDGNEAWISDRFHFSALPNALNIIH